MIHVFFDTCLLSLILCRLTSSSFITNNYVIHSTLEDMSVVDKTFPGEREQAHTCSFANNAACAMFRSCSQAEVMHVSCPKWQYFFCVHTPPSDHIKKQGSPQLELWVGVLPDPSTALCLCFYSTRLLPALGSQEKVFKSHDNHGMVSCHPAVCTII